MQTLLAGAVFVTLSISLGLGASRLQGKLCLDRLRWFVTYLCVAIGLYAGVFWLMYALFHSVCPACRLDAVLVKGLVSVPVVTLVLITQWWKAQQPTTPTGVQSSKQNNTTGKTAKVSVP